MGHYFIFISPLILLIPLIFLGIYEKETVLFLSQFISNFIFVNIIYFLMIFVLMESFLPTLGEMYDLIGFFKTLILFILIILSGFTLFYFNYIDINLILLNIENFFKMFGLSVYLFIIIHYIIIIVVLFFFNLFNFRKK